MDHHAPAGHAAPPPLVAHTIPVDDSVLARSAMADGGLPKAPCVTCNVAHLCLGGVDRPGLAYLDDLTIRRRRLRKGQKLYRAGEPFHFLFAVRVGTLKSSMVLKDGLDHVTSFHFAGDIIGFDGMAGGTMPTTAHALENVEVCSIPYEQLGDACAASPALRKRVSQLTGINILREYRAATLVRRRLIEKRLAGFLLQVAENMHERGYSAREFQLRMSRAEIGSYLGTTLETVSRAFSEFQRQGLVQVHARRVELLRPDQLREFAEDCAQA